MTPRPRYILTLQPQPGGPPDEIRLRRILKDLLRRHVVRLIDIRETPTNAGDHMQATPVSFSDAVLVPAVADEPTPSHDEYVKVRVTAVQRVQYDSIVLMSRRELTAVQIGKAGPAAAADDPLPILLLRELPTDYLGYENVEISEYAGSEKPTRLASLETLF